MLRNHPGERHLFVNPTCKQLIVDLERVRWKNDVHGNAVYEIDKSDPDRSHLTDALGYFISREFGMHAPAYMNSFAR